jgi:carbamoyl-phosphate synthase small subunit
MISTSLYSSVKRDGYLVLPNHVVFKIKALTSEPELEIDGELVFNTGFCGYTEIITDPSYQDQVVLFTHPHVGSYGLSSSEFQSSKPQCTAIVTHRIDDTTDHATFKRFSLIKWLLEHKVPIVFGSPIRALTQRIREQGSMNCKIMVGNHLQPHHAHLAHVNPEPRNFSADLLEKVSVSKKQPFGNANTGKHKLAVVDFGCKRRTLELLEIRGCYGWIYPWNVKWSELMTDHPQGVVLSNGPGDPSKFTSAIHEIRIGIGTVPILAICLGHQLLCLAEGATSYKLKYGHRGCNHPVHDFRSGKTIIASHNHGFAILEDFLSGKSGWDLWFKNLNDQSLSGVRCDSKKILSVQFHPEGAPGPHDAYYIFDEFVSSL